MSAPTTCPNLGETRQNFKLQKGIKRPKASPLKDKIKRFKTNRPLSRCARCEEMQPQATCGSTCIFLMWPDLVVCLCASLLVWLCGFYKNVVVVTNFSWNLPTTACLGDSNVLSAPRQPLDAAALDLSTIVVGQATRFLLFHFSIFNFADPAAFFW